MRIFLGIRKKRTNYHTLRQIEAFQKFRSDNDDQSIEKGFLMFEQTLCSMLYKYVYLCNSGRTQHKTHFFVDLIIGLEPHLKHVF